MTLRDTIRSFLQDALEWAKRNRDYWGSVKDTYQRKLDEERLLAKLRKEAKR